MISKTEIENGADTSFFFLLFLRLRTIWKVSQKMKFLLVFELFELTTPRIIQIIHDIHSNITLSEVRITEQIYSISG
jgi:hypothetical protein